MSVEDVGNEVVRFAVRVAGVAIAVPVVAGFMVLGAAVLVGRSVRDAARALVPWKGYERREQREEDEQEAA
jgi:hypothetical protein